MSTEHIQSVLTPQAIHVLMSSIVEYFSKIMVHFEYHTLSEKTIFTCYNSCWGLIEHPYKVPFKQAIVIRVYLEGGGQGGHLPPLGLSLPPLVNSY